MAKTRQEEVPEFLALPEAARRLGLPVDILQELAEKGKLPGIWGEGGFYCDIPETRVRLHYLASKLLRRKN